jgi:hypothetical protein
MKKSAILIAALAGLLVTAQANAQAPGQGLYIGAGVGSVWSDGGSVFPTTVNEDTSVGGKVYVGYMSNDKWGMELGLHSLGKYESTLNGTKSDEFKTTAISVSAVHTQPLFDWGYNVNFRIGLVFTNAEYDCLQSCSALLVDSKIRGIAGTIGVGIGALIAQNLSMRMDYDHFGHVKHSIGTFEYNEAYDVFSVSLQLRF